MFEISRARLAGWQPLATLRRTDAHRRVSATETDDRSKQTANMALSTDRLGLNNHEVFRELRQHLPKQQTKTKNLIVCNDEMLFVWDPVEECLLTLYLGARDSGSKDYQVGLCSL